MILANSRTRPVLDSLSFLRPETADDLDFEPEDEETKKEDEAAEENEKEGDAEPEVRDGYARFQ